MTHPRVQRCDVCHHDHIVVGATGRLACRDDANRCTRCGVRHVDGCVFVGEGPTIEAAMADIWRRVRGSIDERTDTNEVDVTVVSIHFGGTRAQPSIRVHGRVRGNP